MDSDSHAIASDTGAFSALPNLSTGQSFTHTFGKTGCSGYFPHPLAGG
jgi:L-cystine uptake protein TcyP (sodium:dicarboxylate symporter family)